MTVNDYSERFFGLPVVEFRAGDTVERRECVYRLMQDESESDQTQQEFLEEFLEEFQNEYGTDAALEALILGPWGEASTQTPPTEYLQVLSARRLPKLRALFVGDMTFEDSEISWIGQADYTELLTAYPNLEVLRIRGSIELTLPSVRLPQLRELAIETGGLPSAVVEAIAGMTLPTLKKLELWLGARDYGFDGNLSLYATLLTQIQPERLEYLGLRNAEIADELAGYIARQPWLAGLHTLDLSMGTLGDVGAKALLASPYLRGLKALDLRHHYISEPLIAQLRGQPLQLSIDDAQDDAEDDRYVQVGE